MSRGRSTGGIATAADSSFVVDIDRVAHETIDDETILIDLVSGTYYSLEGSASEIWELLSSGRSLASAEGVLNRRYPSDAAHVRRELHRLVQELVDEQLLLLAPVGDGLVAGDELPPAGEPPARPFDPPVVQRYTDMEYFLRLDPIHETNEALGWPEPASDRAGR